MSSSSSTKISASSATRRARWRAEPSRASGRSSPLRARRSADDLRASSSDELLAPFRIGGERVDQRRELRLRQHARGRGCPALTASLRTVLAEEPPRRLLVFRRRLAAAEPFDALQQRLVLSKRLVVAELFQRDQAGGLDVVIVRLVEQDLARLLLQLVRVQTNAAQRPRSAGSRATPSCRAAPSRTAAPPWRRPQEAAAPRASRRRSAAS